jgi:SulP family sulfate permease
LDAVESFESIASGSHNKINVFIVRLKHVPFIEATGLLSLHKVIEGFENRGTKVLLSEANEKVCQKIKRAGVQDSFDNNLIQRSRLLALKISEEN